MVELEIICGSTLESDRNNASNRLGCLSAYCCEGTCRTDRLAVWTIKLISR